MPECSETQKFGTVITATLIDRVYAILTLLLARSQYSVAMWFPPIPSLPSSPPFYDFIEQWKANRTCSEYSARRCTGTVVASLFRIDFSAAGVIDSRCRPIWLWADMEEFVINRLYKFRKLFWILNAGERATSFELWRRDKREGATLVQQICDCCFQPVVLSSDRIIVQRMKNSFRLAGFIVDLNERGGKLCALIFSNWQVKFYFSFFKFYGNSLDARKLSLIIFERT